MSMGSHLYAPAFGGANTLIIMLEVKEGTIWATVTGLTKLRLGQDSARHGSKN